MGFWTKWKNWRHQRQLQKACEFMVLQAFEENIWHAEELLRGWYHKFDWRLVEDVLDKLAAIGILRWQQDVRGPIHLILTSHGCRCAQYLKAGHGLDLE